MGCLMFKELVKRKVFPVVSVMVGSIFLASCSSGVSRFDFPMFGLSKTNDQSASTASLGGARLGQDVDNLAVYSRDSGLSGFENDNNSNVISSGSTNYNNSRTSYLPPQTAAPEVRSARYGAVDRSPLASFGQPTDSRTYVRGQTTSRTVGAQKGASDYNSQPMKPIKEARRSFLPSEPSGYNYNGRKTTRTSPVAAQPRQRPAVRVVSPEVSNTSGGNQAITVRMGDTLYSIGRRHNVSVVKLMEINDLSDSNLAVGQQLVVPGSGDAQRVRTVAVRPKTSVKASRSGTYTVRPGENFHGIAGKLGINASTLADINGITDPGSIRAGEVLILPANRKAVPQKSVAKVKRSRSAGLQVRSVKTKTIKLNAVKTKVTSVSRKQVSVASKKRAKNAEFRWPVRGRIIQKFGPRGDGTHNDGVNLAVPNGTQVKAAEAGVVAYAGSELKGYGNLVLIRHANDWVSAYAHNNKLMVKRGDTIKRGQVVARAGMSGSVEQPQVHFELRKGSKPVDPTKFMAGT